MSNAVPLWVVELQGPKNKRHFFEVPTFHGKEAAERRALVTAWSVGIGDIDEVAVLSSWLDTDAPYTPAPGTFTAEETSAL